MCPDSLDICLFIYWFQCICLDWFPYFMFDVSPPKISIGNVPVRCLHMSLVCHHLIECQWVSVACVKWFVMNKPAIVSIFDLRMWLNERLQLNLVCKVCLYMRLLLILFSVYSCVRMTYLERKQFHLNNGSISGLMGSIYLVW